MSRTTFFRQSGWMMFATVASGVMMLGIHFLSKKIPPAEYGTLVTLLAATIVIPSIPLQMVLAQQTAAARASGQERQLAGMVRMACLGIFLFWLLAAAVVLGLQQHILARWQIANPAALWTTLLVALGCLWLPMFLGLLQGDQNFAWFGWATILNGVGRIASATVIVLALGGYAAGIMTGVLIGMVVALAIGIWQTRHLWSGQPQPFDWRALLRQVIPLMLGFGACQFLFSADTMFVKAHFTSDETGFYGAAGTLSRALVWLVGPLAAVMFPKIVHSTAKSEESNLVGITLLGTGVLAACGALGLCVLAPWVIKFVYKTSYLEVATSVLPWYAGSMVPFSLAYVLVNNLLARAQFRVVPWLVVLAAAYAFALTRLHSSLVAVLQTLGVFCILLLIICTWFTWGTKAKVRVADGR
jgi:O-antigen/teichoic acid export membrane protein